MFYVYKNKNHDRERQRQRCRLSELKIISFVLNCDGFVSLLYGADDWYFPLYCVCVCVCV
jgi:hypothetical protein